MEEKLSKFGLEYQVIPEFLYTLAITNAADLIKDISLLKDFTEDEFNIHKFDFDWNDIHVTTQEVGKYMYYIFTFPEADKEGLAKYGVVVVTEDKSVRAYSTLEKSKDDSLWFVCSHDTHKHTNYGELNKEPTIENFVERIKKMVR